MEGLVVVSYWTRPVDGTRVTIAGLRECTTLASLLLFVAMPFSVMAVPGRREVLDTPRGILLGLVCFGITFLVLGNQWLRYRTLMMGVGSATPLLVAANVCMALPWIGVMLATANEIKQQMSSASVLRYAGWVFVLLLYQRCFGAICNASLDDRPRIGALVGGNLRMRLLHIQVSLAAALSLFSPRSSLLLIFVANTLFLWMEMRS